MPPPPFSDLPAEIHLLIANHGTPNNLLSLIRTCSKLHDRCLALLWQDVDLSIHHEPDYALAMHEIQEFYWYNKVVFKGREEDREDALKLTKRPDMVRKIPCLDAVGEKPELAARVRSLKWTMIDPRNSVGESWTLATAKLWNNLSLMQNVVEVDIAWAIMLEPLVPMDVPKSLRLFPAATSITLRGLMHARIALAVFEACDLARVQYLCFDNLRALDGLVLATIISGRDVYEDYNARSNRHGSPGIRGSFDISFINASSRLQ